MGRSFNHIVQCDMFFHWDSVLILLIDECTRYKFVDLPKTRTYQEILEMLAKGWLKYLGPPKIFLTD